MPANIAEYREEVKRLKHLNADLLQQLRVARRALNAFYVVTGASSEAREANLQWIDAAIDKATKP